MYGRLFTRNTISSFGMGLVVGFGAGELQPYLDMRRDENNLRVVLPTMATFLAIAYGMARAPIGERIGSGLSTVVGFSLGYCLGNLLVRNSLAPIANPMRPHI